MGVGLCRTLFSDKTYKLYIEKFQEVNVTQNFFECNQTLQTGEDDEQNFSQEIARHYI